MGVCSVSCNMLSSECCGTAKLDMEKRYLRCSVKCEGGFFFCPGNTEIKILTDLIISY